ncbi:MAG: corrinoid protein [Actinomycetota bacterium]|nr:corrinoid protein [Actinomycetota bacterium]
MDILTNIKEGITAGDPVNELVQEALSSIEPELILNRGVVAGIRRAGELWQEGEYFLPDVILAAETFKEAMELLEPRIGGGADKGAGSYLIGVVEGDMHDLGKSIVIAMLTSGGFEVIDLGSNVPIQTFVDKVREHQPDIVGVGAYMSTTMLLMKDVVEALEKAGLRDGVKVMVGGVPITPQYAEDVGADSYGRDAMEALENARKLMGVES